MARSSSGTLIVGVGLSVAAAASIYLYSQTAPGKPADKSTEPESRSVDEKTLLNGDADKTEASAQKVHGNGEAEKGQDALLDVTASQNGPPQEEIAILVVPQVEESISLTAARAESPAPVEPPPILSQTEVIVLPEVRSQEPLEEPNKAEEIPLEAQAAASEPTLDVVEVEEELVKEIAAEVLAEPEVLDAVVTAEEVIEQALDSLPETTEPVSDEVIAEALTKPEIVDAVATAAEIIEEALESPPETTEPTSDEAVVVVVAETIEAVPSQEDAVEETFEETELNLVVDEPEVAVSESLSDAPIETTTLTDDDITTEEPTTSDKTYADIVSGSNDTSGDGLESVETDDVFPETAELESEPFEGTTSVTPDVSSEIKLANRDAFETSILNPKNMPNF